MSDSQRSRASWWRIPVGIVLGVAGAAALFPALQPWWPAITSPGSATDTGSDSDADHVGSSGPTLAAPPRVLELSPQARQNLKLVSKPVRLQAYWRTILVPGEIVDRPGVTDRGVTAPAVGVVTQVHAFPGDTVRPGDKLFTLRLLSEYIQNSQSELFKATRETQLVKEQRERLAKVAEDGAIPQVRLIEIDQQLRRLQALIQAYRQDLLTRGLKPEQLAEVTEGNFVATIDVVAPPAVAAAMTIPGPRTDPPTTGPDASGPPSEATTQAVTNETIDSTTNLAATADSDQVYEVQSLKVDLGTQVQAGQALAVLANHRSLFLSGHAFKRDAPYLERAAQRGWPIQVEFAEDEPEPWPPLDQTFAIRHLANSIDPNSRTFEFFIPLKNQSRSYEQEGRRFVVWRFRPGQRVRLHVPVEEFRDVIVLPAGAIVREGPEAYVFRQNGDLFDRRPVRVLHEDRLQVVIANDGSVFPGWFLAQGSAASLNRVLKAQAANGTPAGFHVHADGSVHGAH